MTTVEEVTTPGRPLREYFHKALERGEVGLASMMLMPSDTGADWGPLSPLEVRALNQALEGRGLEVVANEDQWRVCAKGAAS